MSENTRFRAALIAKLALTIVVAGVLVAGLLLPWVGGVGPRRPQLGDPAARAAG